MTDDEHLGLQSKIQKQIQEAAKLQSCDRAYAEITCLHSHGVATLEDITHVQVGTNKCHLCQEKVRGNSLQSFYSALLYSKYPLNWHAANCLFWPVFCFAEKL